MFCFQENILQVILSKIPIHRFCDDAHTVLTQLQLPTLTRIHSEIQICCLMPIYTPLMLPLPRMFHAGNVVDAEMPKVLTNERKCNGNVVSAAMEQCARTFCCLSSACP